jgi:chemotaxis protein methyltransferase CheR
MIGTLAKSSFDTFRRIVYDRAGINISGNKEALVAARVGKRMRELAITDENEYLDLLFSENGDDETVHLLDVISTNVTSFFREPEHFRILGEVLSELYDKGQRKFRIWCAAASSGEEPYTLAMTAMETLDCSSCDVKILATDISTRVLRKCVEGRYGEDKIEPVPPQMRKKYFDETQAGNKKVFCIKNELKSRISFTRLNLSKPPFPMSGPFDVVFVRNVMIYFDNEVRKKLLDDVNRLLNSNGYLFVGHAESLAGLLSNFKAVKPSVYKKAS